MSDATQKATSRLHQSALFGSVLHALLMRQRVVLLVWLWAKPLVGASGEAVSCRIVFVSVLCENVLKVTINTTDLVSHCVLSIFASFVLLVGHLANFLAFLNGGLFQE